VAVTRLSADTPGRDQRQRGQLGEHQVVLAEGKFLTGLGNFVTRLTVSDA
jgi:hypothetical protein